MPRPPSVRYREQDGYHYTKVNGRRIKLSKDKVEARRLFHKLMATDAPVRSSGITCRKLLDTYLTKTADRRSVARTHTLVNYLKRFCDAHGPRRPRCSSPTR